LRVVVDLAIPTKEGVLKAYAKEKDSGLDLDLNLPHASGLAFYPGLEAIAENLTGNQAKSVAEMLV